MRERSEAEKVQIDLLRKAGPARRAQMAFSLSATVISLARRAIRRQLAEPTEEEVGHRFVELHYGRELGAAVRAYLDSRRFDLGERRGGDGSGKISA